MKASIEDVPGSEVKGILKKKIGKQQSIDGRTMSRIVVLVVVISQFSILYGLLASDSVPEEISLPNPSAAKIRKRWFESEAAAGVDVGALSKDEFARQEAIYELIDSEEDYVNDLTIMINVYSHFDCGFLDSLTVSFLRYFYYNKKTQ